MGAIRWPRRVEQLVLVAVVAATCLLLAPRLPTAPAATPLSISVVGNHFVNGGGQTIRLLGVNREGTEYACVDGTGYSVGPEDASDAMAIAAWHANAVRIPINEDCWLGINGLPAYGTAAGYRQMIQSYVSALNADGIYAILDLQWTAPGSVPANGLRAMPDDHSPTFWTSVASTFADDPAVVFDVFNEPHSVTWSCWRDGGCTLPSAPDGTTPNASQTYTAVGMQALVNAIRATGAHQPILVGGLDHGNDLGGWLANMPSDPDRQLAASFHAYLGNSCTTTSCWDSTVAPVAAAVPVTTDEFSEDDCSENYDNSLMSWADAHGIGYLGWGWFILSAHCQSLYLIIDWNGDPASPNGTALKDHLAALWATGPASGSSGPASGSSGPASGSSGQTQSPSGGGASTASGHRAGPARPKVRWLWIRLTGHSLSIRLRSSLPATGQVIARTGSRLRATDRRPSHRRWIALGSERFSLPPRTWRVIKLKLAPMAGRLLARHRTVRVQVTVTVAAADSGGLSVARVVEVRAPRVPVRTTDAANAP
jgi:Cellulase (glycosyl hydrolase family 5)